MKKLISLSSMALVMALLFSLLPIQANAQFIQTGGGTTAIVNGNSTANQAYYFGAVPQCVQLTSNFGFGARDYYAGGQVSQLQNFLISKGYLAAGKATGYYGALTVAAVRQFQAQNGIQAVGSVGPYTRARIQSISCNNNGGTPSTNTPVITSLSPTSGAVGTYVTVYGTGFNSSNNIVVFGNSGSVPSVASANGTSLTFRVPESLTPACYYGNPACYITMMYRPTTPGVYPVSIQNSRGTSNSINFTVTSGSVGDTNGTPSINGVDAPTYLNVNQTGTWYVRATDPTGQGLSYSVTWGDENTYAAGYYAPYSGNFTQSSTFTHAYYRAGTYTAKFTVRAQNGRTAETTMTVNVGTQSGSYYPTISSISPSSGPFGTVVTITGTNFDRYNNSINFANVNNVDMNVPSSDGRTLQFTIPATPCTEGYACNQMALQNGTYPVSVTTPNGTSNSFNFNVSSTVNGGVDQTVTAYINQAVYVNDLMIMPTSIAEDSRCPQDVQCIQAGKVVVNTTLRGPNSQITAAMQYGASNSVSRVDGYNVQITGVEPVKYSTQTVPYYQYRITYRVTR